jgi:hypothetical protein
MGVARRERRWAIFMELSGLRFSSAISQEHVRQDMPTLSASCVIQIISRIHDAIVASVRQPKKFSPMTP